MNLIEVKGLKKSFGSLEVLKGIDLTVEQGERIAIIGGSGCGRACFCVPCACWKNRTRGKS